MSTLSWEYVPSKTGVPRYCQVDRYEHSKKGWLKIPGTIADVEKEIILVRELKWSELTDEQKTGIYNHTFKFTTNIVGAERFPGPGKNDENRFIFQEKIGYFSINYNGGSYDLYIQLPGESSPRHIIRNRPLKVPHKMVFWLKSYAQYIQDEPELLNRIIRNPILKARWGIVDDLYRLLPTGSRTFSPMYEEHGYPAPGF